MRDTRNSVAQKLEPGAIGNGKPLQDMLRGKLPQKINLSNVHGQEELLKKIRESIRIAVKLYLENSDKLPMEHWKRARIASHALIDFNHELSQTIHLFYAPVIDSENYLLGFNHQGIVGLEKNLVESLYKESPVRLAQYIFHECIPEHLKIAQDASEIDRTDHREIYTEIQSAIFGEEEVAALKKDLRSYITNKYHRDRALAPTTFDGLQAILTPAEKGVVTRALKNGIDEKEIIGAYQIVLSQKLHQDEFKKILSLAVKHQTKPSVASNWILVAERVGGKSESMAKWTEDYARVMYAGNEWADFDPWRQQSIIRNDFLDLVEAYKGVAYYTRGFSFMQALKLYSSLSELGVVIGDLPSVLHAFASVPIQPGELSDDNTSHYDSRIKLITDFVQKCNVTYLAPKTLTMLIIEGESVAFQVHIRGIGMHNYVPGGGGALTLSGRGLSPEQHALVNEAISTYFSTGAEGKKILQPEVSWGVYQTLDPKGVLAEEGIKIYLLSELNSRIKELAEAKHMSFDEVIIMHPGTFKGSEKHLFVTEGELGYLTALSEASRIAISQHELSHIKDINTDEATIQKTSPVKDALEEYKKIRSENPGLFGFPRLEGVELTPQEVALVRKHLDKGTRGREIQALVQYIGRLQLGKTALLDTLKLAEAHKTKPTVAAKWVIIEDLTGVKSSRIAKYTKSLVSTMNKHTHWNDFSQWKQDFVIREQVFDLVRAYERAQKENTRIRMDHALNLYAGLSIPGVSIDDFDAVLEKVVSTKLQPYENKVGADIYMDRIQRIIDFAKKSVIFVVTPEVVELLLTEGESTVFTWFWEQYGFPLDDDKDSYLYSDSDDDDLDEALIDPGVRALLLSGNGLTPEQHKVVNTAISTYFPQHSSEVTQAPQELPEEIYAAIDPDGVLRDAGIKIYDLHGLNERIKMIASLKNVDFDDVLIIHPGTYSGHEKHLFVEFNELTRLQSISRKSMAAIALHELKHLDDIKMPESEVQKIAPTEEALAELRSMPRTEDVSKEQTLPLSFVDPNSEGQETLPLIFSTFTHLSEKDKTALRKAIDEGHGARELYGLVDFLKINASSEDSVSDTLSLAQRHNTKPIVASKWQVISDQTGFSSRSIAEWTEEYSSQMDSRSEWQDYDVWKQNSILLNNIKELAEQYDEIKELNPKIKMSHVIRLNTGLNIEGVVVEDFYGVLEAFATTKLRKDETETVHGSSPYTNRAEQIIAFAKKGVTRVITSELIEVFLTKGESAAMQWYINTFGMSADYNRGDGGALLLSGKGLTAEQHALVNQVISEYFTEDEEGNTIPPNEITEQDYKIIDPMDKLNEFGAKIYLLDKLNEKIQLAAQEKGIDFADVLIIHPGTFSGKEKHLFIDTEELSSLRSISAVSRENISLHEYLHLKTIERLEEEIQDMLSVDSALKELRQVRENTSRLPQIFKELNVDLSPEETTSVLAAIDRGHTEREMGGLVRFLRDTSGSSESIPQTLALSKRYKTKPKVAGGWVLVGERTGISPKKIARWTFHLTKLLNKNARWHDFDQWKQEGMIRDQVLELAEYYSTVRENTPQMKMELILELYAGLSEPHMIVENLEEIINVIATTVLLPSEDVAGENPYANRIYRVLNFANNSNINVITPELVETLILKGEIAALNWFIRENTQTETGEGDDGHGTGLLASGKGLNEGQNKIVNEVISGYFAEGEKPPVLSDEMLKKLDPAGLMDGSNTKVYVLESFNDKIKTLALKKGLPFSDTVIIHPGTYKGKERHLFIEKAELEKILDLPENLRKLLMNHELFHVDNIQLLEEEAVKKFPAMANATGAPPPLSTTASPSTAKIPPPTIPPTPIAATAQ
ncbi:hypothetical protein ACFL4E_02270 [Candidatus Omnitrophota bacterium]